MLALACTEGEGPFLEDAGVSSVELVRARLRDVRGTVMVKRWYGDDWVPAAEGMELYENDKVRTAASAQARIELASGGSVQLAEDALIAIAESQPRPGLDRSDVTVLRGRIDAELHDAKKQSLSVTTPSATIRAGREIVFQ